MKVLTSSSELEDTQSAFASGVKTLAHEMVETSIGYQGGIYDTEVI